MSESKTTKALHPEFNYRVDYVGHEQQPVLVVNQFIAAVGTLVDYAARSAVFSATDSNYPGVRAPAPNLYVQLFHYHLHDLIKEVFGLRDEWVTSVRSDFSIVTTSPEKLSVSQALPHFDSTNARELAAVHYLCDESHGGTALYRHMSTGYETVKPDNLDHYKKTLLLDCQKFPVSKSYMNGSNAIFEQTANYGACFNKLIIYPCNLLHSGNIPENFRFDENPHTGRLTLNTFIYARVD